MPSRVSLVTVKRVQHLILLIRGERVILDTDLAQLYGVATKSLNQAVKRNRNRFPPDFMFRLTRNETNEVVTNRDHLARLRFSHVRPHAFTEHGTIMLANVLKSKRAVEASVQVVRAFVRLREMLASNHELTQKLTELERRVAGHDEQIEAIFEAIRQLLNPPNPRKRQIGFQVKERPARYGARRKAARR